MKLKGIDISEHNGNVNIQTVKDSGIAYAILRTGFGDTQAGRKDYKFDEYYNQAKKAGMPVGTYHYLYSTDPSQAGGEAQNCINIMQGKAFEYPVWADFEDASQTKLSVEVCVDIIYNFCKTVRDAGYYVGWYTYLSFYNKLKTASNFSKLGGLDFWLAEYNGRDGGSIKCDMWQYTSDGDVNGSSPRTDLNECYLDYPTIIKAKGLNGYQGVTQAPVKPTAPKPSAKWDLIKEIGVFYPNQYVEVSNEPTQASPRIAYYDKGSHINYDSYVKNDGYVFVSYISTSGVRRYVPCRNIATNIPLGTFK